MAIEFCGIDFGAKLAGTTVICYVSNNKIEFVRAQKKQNADQMIIDFITTVKPAKVFIDAPLSLPLAYFKKGSNFFFRKCDIQIEAMSPMFLGGITARAMQLQNHFKNDVLFFETYPAALAKTYNLQSLNYKKDHNFISKVVAEIVNQVSFDFQINHAFKTWHEVDALLAFCSGYRYLNNQSQIVGVKNEGQIIF